MADRPNPQKIAQQNFNVLILGIVLITLLFLVYNYFMSSKPTRGMVEGTETSIVDKIKDVLTEPKKEGQIDEMAAKDSRDEIIAGATSQNLSQWVATDYTQGDIQSGVYTVQTGDTLWEIAEAVYGDGTQWKRILEANNKSVGFLPDGSQALIVTGQLLVLP